MKFATLQEYFYKIQSALFLMVLLPLAVFIFLYTVGGIGVIANQRSVLVIGLLVASFVQSLVSTIIFNRRLASIRRLAGLRLKLEGYYSITTVRTLSGTGACLLLAVGFFLTAHPLLTYAFAGLLFLFFVVWPWPAKVCRDLKLKGDEWEMVRHKKDIF